MRQGHTLNGKSFKVHLDGTNLLPFFKGDVKETPRPGFFYWSDDGDLMALRYRDWKIAFLEQNTQISPEYPQGVWMGQFTTLRIPKVYNLRSDPFERGPDSIYYADWFSRRIFILVPAQALVAQWLDSFKDFPPRSRPASFTVSDAMAKIVAVNRGQD